MLCLHLEIMVSHDILACPVCWVSTIDVSSYKNFLSNSHIKIKEQLKNFFPMHCAGPISASFVFCIEHVTNILDFMPDIFTINTILFFAIAF